LFAFRIDRLQDEYPEAAIESSAFLGDHARRRVGRAGRASTTPSSGRKVSMTMAGGERAHAIGKISVRKYEPTAYDELAEGPALVRIHVEEDFSGDVVGSGVAEFLQTARSDTAASFVGVERVTGSLGGRSGSFVFQDQGTLQAGVVSGSWFVVPGSGTGDLRGLRGEGGFRANLGEGADITLDYWFE
jgi:Protein of unknown function (DUF3224)